MTLKQILAKAFNAGTSDNPSTFEEWYKSEIETFKVGDKVSNIEFGPGWVVAEDSGKIAVSFTNKKGTEMFEKDGRCVAGENNPKYDLKKVFV